jgi:hypothetical protein
MQFQKKNKNYLPEHDYISEEILLLCVIGLSVANMDYWYTYVPCQCKNGYRVYFISYLTISIMFVQ